jgi:hypothetical protein
VKEKQNQILNFQINILYFVEIIFLINRFVKQWNESVREFEKEMILFFRCETVVKICLGNEENLFVFRWFHSWFDWKVFDYF